MFSYKDLIFDLKKNSINFDEDDKNIECVIESEESFEKFSQKLKEAGISFSIVHQILKIMPEQLASQNISPPPGYTVPAQQLLAFSQHTSSYHTTIRSMHQTIPVSSNPQQVSTSLNTHQT